ncbi:putative propionyl- carboxylase [Diplodia seriata]|uniref:Putative propionyl-carboxylase n=1 Tax=Diplodia seriata TaxID=420778 RepID=A0A0G2DS45_9PEZI|nr:putative propionyl- carboxylase [Diplodia seriata]
MPDNSDNDSKKSSSSAATSRLAQVSNHISPPSPATTPDPPNNNDNDDKKPRRNRRRRNRTTAATLPADYSDILSQLNTLHTIARNPDPAHRGYARQKASGKLWVRERIAQLLDPSAPFHEIGSASGTVTWGRRQDSSSSSDLSNPPAHHETPTAFTPSNNVLGLGTILTANTTTSRRRILLTADDFTLRAGHADGAVSAKSLYGEQLALALRLPVVKLVDGSSGGGSVSTIREAGWSVVPRRRERMYNPRKIITTVVDRGTWFEIGALWGTTAIVGLARLGGRPIGIVSLNCEVNAGALDSLGSQKITRHLKFCDVFNIPVVQFVDIPGYAVGTVAERTATMRHGITLATTYYSTSIPIFSVIVRRVYGVAGGIMVDSREPHMRVAWPSGEWGSLPLDGGIEASHSHELKEIERKEGKGKMKERYKELEQEYRRLMNPFTD